MKHRPVSRWRTYWWAWFSWNWPHRDYGLMTPLFCIRIMANAPEGFSKEYRTGFEIGWSFNPRALVDQGAEPFLRWHSRVERVNRDAINFGRASFR